MSEYTIDEAVEKRFNNLKCRPREYVDRILLEDIERIWRRCRDLQDRIEVLESNSNQIEDDPISQVTEDMLPPDMLERWKKADAISDEWRAEEKKKYEAFYQGNDICPGQTDILAMINNPDNQIRTEKQRLAAVKRSKPMVSSGPVTYSDVIWSDSIEPDYDALVRGMKLGDLSIYDALRVYRLDWVKARNMTVDNLLTLFPVMSDGFRNCVQLNLYSDYGGLRPFTKADYERLKNGL